MAETKPVKSRRALDEESNLMIYQGVTMSHICTIFEMDLRDVKEKLVGRVAPVGARSGNEIYKLKDVAQHLVKPDFDIDEFIRRMSIADLPPILRKEYWAGLRSRQLYEKEAAELWSTGDVVAMVGELFKTLRLSLLQTRESVERETELTDRQRSIITKIIDNALEEVHAATTRRFSEAAKGRPSVRAAAEDESHTEDL